MKIAPRAALGWLVVALATPAVADDERQLAYPETRRESVSVEIFGEKVRDPYRWLENADSEEVRSWSRAQATLARSYLDALPGRKVLATRLRELISARWVGSPLVRGGRQFYEVRRAELDKPVLHWRQGDDGPLQTLVDPNALSTPDKNVSLGVWAVTRDGKTIAYVLRENNADEGVLYVKDVESGRGSSRDVLSGIKWAEIAWSLDGRGFYYTYFPTDPSIPETERHGYAEVRFHELGTPQSEDALVFERTGDPTKVLSCQLSWDGRWLFVSVWHGWVGVDIFVRDLKAEKAAFRSFYSSGDSQVWVTAFGDYFYLHSNEGASNWKLLRVPAGVFDRAAWETIVEEPKGAVLSDVYVFGGRLLLRLLRDARHELQIRSLEGKLIRKVELPAEGVAESINGNPDDDEAYYEFSSFAVPWQVYQLSMSSGKPSLWFKADIRTDASMYSIQQTWFESKDGTRVPMFLVHRKDIARDGSTPFLLTGYGGFGISYSPWFFPEIYPWLEAGGGYALANLRGGGEYGEKWHRAGMRRNKQNVFDDFIAAAETLIERGYTRSDRLAIVGRSNGGLLVGAAVTQRPDLFGAVICGVPLSDMVRYTKMGVGQSWVEEYGSPEEEADFRVLYAYSPYHRVVKGTPYPPILVHTTDHDDRVDPAHSRKLAAALQAADAGANPMLLSVTSQAGHGGADRITPEVERWTDEYAFIMARFGMTPNP